MNETWSSRSVRNSRIMKGAAIVAAAIATYFLVNLMWMRQVVDDTTKQPLNDAYVILAFKGDFYFGVESRYRCYRLDVEKTDAAGHFLFPPWRRSLNPFLSDARVEMTLYKAGYRALDQVPMAGEPFKMVPDSRPWRSNPSFGIDPIPAAIMPAKAKPGVPAPVPGAASAALRVPPNERIEGRDASLLAVVTKLTHCGGVVDERKEEVLVALYNEVRSMDEVDWGFVSNLLYEIEKIDNGGELDKFGGVRRGPASDHYAKRNKQLEQRSANIGTGDLWDLPRIANPSTEPATSVQTSVPSPAPPKSSGATSATSVRPDLTVVRPTASFMIQAPSPVTDSAIEAQRKMVIQRIEQRQQQVQQTVQCCNKSTPTNTSTDSTPKPEH